jgi:hypothetical protein
MAYGTSPRCWRYSSSEGPENNHIFTIQQITTDLRENKASDDSVCAKFGFKETGCIALFEHKEAPEGTDAAADH